MDVPIDELESVRQRLSQLTHWLNRLQAIAQQPQLPPYHLLHSQFAMVMKQLSALSSTLATHADTLRATAAYPLPKFPVATEAGLLATLLRKRNEPEVDAWIEAGRETQQLAGKSGARDELWAWAAEVVAEERSKYTWTDVGETNQSVSEVSEVGLDQVLKFMYGRLTANERSELEAKDAAT